MRGMTVHEGGLITCVSSVCNGCTFAPQGGDLVEKVTIDDTSSCRFLLVSYDDPHDITITSRENTA